MIERILLLWSGYAQFTFDSTFYLIMFVKYLLVFAVRWLDGCTWKNSAFKAQGYWTKNGNPSYIPMKIWNELKNACIWIKCPFRKLLMVSDTVFKRSKRKTAFLGPYLVYAKVEIWTGAECPGFRRSWLWSVPWRSGAGQWRCPSPGPETRSPWRCPLWCPLGVWQKMSQRYDVHECIPIQDS